MKWTYWIAVIGIGWGLAAPDVACAEIYQWTDVKGVEHFSMDLVSVPSEYRAAAEASAGSVGKDAIVNVIPNRVPKTENPRASRSAGPAARSPGYSRRIGSAPQESELLGGHGESWWRTRVETLQSEMSALDERIHACSGLKIPVRYDNESGRRIKRRHFEARAEVVSRCSAQKSSREAKERQLANLKDRAHRQGVPPGWLRSR